MSAKDRLYVRVRESRGSQREARRRPSPLALRPLPQRPPLDAKRLRKRPPQLPNSARRWSITDHLAQALFLQRRQPFGGRRLGRSARLLPEGSRAQDRHRGKVRRASNREAAHGSNPATTSQDRSALAPNTRPAHACSSSRPTPPWSGGPARPIALGRSGSSFIHP